MIMIIFYMKHFCNAFWLKFTNKFYFILNIGMSIGLVSYNIWRAFLKRWRDSMFFCEFWLYRFSKKSFRYSVWNTPCFLYAEFQILSENLGKNYSQSENFAKYTKQSGNFPGEYRVCQLTTCASPIAKTKLLLKNLLMHLYSYTPFAFLTPFF